MTSILSLLVRRASHLADGEPIISLFLCAALLAVFLAALHQTKPATEPGGGVSLLWMLCKNLARFIWALLLVALVIWAMATLRSYLRETTAHFQRTHGRVTQANYNAVQTIWGGEQTQGELKLEIYNDEEVTERIESEDTTKPAILRKKTVRHFATGNPFVAAHHDVTLKQNPRKKGSAFYGGYETDCRFTWKLRNPADAPFKCNLTFPLPADGAMYDDLSATLNGKDVLPQMDIKDNTLVLARDLQPNEAMNFAITFKSRGMSSWYFQVRESREIRDFLLTLTLPDLPKAKLDYPYGCMTPTDIAPTADNAGCVLTYRLDHALSNKGMGISLPQLPQPGATTNAVLGQTETAWLLTFALLMGLGGGVIRDLLIGEPPASLRTPWPIAAVVVCADIAPITRWPDSIASSASATTAGDRRSSMTRTSGFSRSAARTTAAISSLVPRTSRWLTRHPRLSCAHEIRLSIVIT